MFSLLKICVTGFRGLKDNFELNFLPSEKVYFDKGDSEEIFKLAENLYAHNIIGITGSNATGKTTVLDLIFNCLCLLNNGQLLLTDSDFNKSKMNLRIEFFLDGKIYIFTSIISLAFAKTNLNDVSLRPIFDVKENIKVAKYNKDAGKKYLEKLEFKDMVFDRNSTLLQYGLSNIKTITGGKINANLFRANFFTFDPNVLEEIFNMLKKEKPSILSSVLKILDPSIEKFVPEGRGFIKLKRFGKREIIVTFAQSLSLLSSGTIKGLILYLKFISTMKTGGIILVDEIENSFTKALYSNILRLIKDKKINTNDVQIIFTTHYIEIIDLLRRRDDIYYVERYEQGIDILNFHSVAERSDIVRSIQFRKVFSSRMSDYDNLMALKKEIKNEVSNIN